MHHLTRCREGDDESWCGLHHNSSGPGSGTRAVDGTERVNSSGPPKSSRAEATLRNPGNARRAADETSANTITTEMNTEYQPVVISPRPSMRVRITVALVS